MSADALIILGLGLILMLVLVLPFVSKRVEHNLEVFLFMMGTSAALISGVLGMELIAKALEEPVLIAIAVLVSGVVFKFFQRRIRVWVNALLRVVPFPLFIFGFVTVLGLSSSFITVIIASLVLVEIVNALEVSRETKVSLDIIACFAIGLGAALTPVGEPLSTIATSKLGRDFWYLFRLLGVYLIPGIAAIAAFGALYLERKTRVPPSAADESAVSYDTEGTGSCMAAGTSNDGGLAERAETYLDVVIRALKVYLFVMALVFLGEGFKPIIDRYVIHLGTAALFWLNIISAILDNATLTAAEISRGMTDLQVRSILLGLLISGGMLIPGNIPNIISAGKLGIRSREWARLGIPVGLVIMVFYFLVLQLLGV